VTSPRGPTGTLAGHGRRECGERIHFAAELVVPSDAKLPLPPEVRHDRFEVIESGGGEPIPAPLEVTADVDEPRVAKDPQVLGHRGAADPVLPSDDRRQFTGRVLTAGENIDDAAAGRLGQRLEGITRHDDVERVGAAHAGTVGMTSDIDPFESRVEPGAYSRRALHFRLTQDRTQTAMNFRLTQDRTQTAMNFRLTQDRTQTAMNFRLTQDRTQTAMNFRLTQDRTQTAMNFRLTQDRTQTAMNFRLTQDRTQTAMNTGLAQRQQHSAMSFRLTQQVGRKRRV
jgi:hypothetical protein